MLLFCCSESFSHSCPLVCAFISGRTFSVMPSDLFQVIFGAIHDNWAIPALIRSVCEKRYLKDACCELIRWNDYGCSVLQCPSGFYVQKIMLVLAKMQISVLYVLSLSLNYRMKALMCSLNRIRSLNSKASADHLLMILQPFRHRSVPPPSASPHSLCCWRWSPQVSTCRSLWPC